MNFSATFEQNFLILYFILLLIFLFKKMAFVFTNK